MAETGPSRRVRVETVISQVRQQTRAEQDVMRVFVHSARSRHSRIWDTLSQLFALLVATWQARQKATPWWSSTSPTPLTPWNGMPSLLQWRVNFMNITDWHRITALAAHICHLEITLSYLTKSVNKATHSRHMDLAELLSWFLICSCTGRSLYWETLWFLLLIENRFWENSYFIFWHVLYFVNVLNHEAWQILFPCVSLSVVRQRYFGSYAIWLDQRAFPFPQNLKCLR